MSDAMGLTCVQPTTEGAKGPHYAVPSLEQRIAVDAPVYAGTREEWAIQMLVRMIPALCTLGIAMPEGRGIRIGVVPLPESKLGQCHAAAQSASGNVNFIALSTRQADPVELAHTLVHEFVHACDNCQSGHRGRWARWAALLGMSAQSHTRNEWFDMLLYQALVEVGVPLQHEPSVPNPRKSTTSQVRVTCPCCAQHAYIPHRAFDEGYRVSCTRCTQEMQPLTGTA